jgi:C-3',4' desaturase CrtD
MPINPTKLFNSKNHVIPENNDIIIIGSGLGSLTAAALLVNEGYKVTILEKNYLPGGCTSSYERKGFIFESGATTLVGLDEGMPLNALLRKTGIEFPVRKLETPMQVILKSGKVLTRHLDIEDWILEAELAFGKQGMRPFWEECYKISKKVWQVSSRQLHFPPDASLDYLSLVKNIKVTDFGLLPYMFKNLADLLKKHDLQNNAEFIDFIDEQLMITAQNKHSSVHSLFGATALCYTNFSNYYVDGGLVRMIAAFVDFIESKGGQIFFRTSVERIEKSNSGFKVTTKDSSINCKRIISGIPLNNLKQLYSFKNIKLPFHEMQAKDLNSAFQAGIVFRTDRIFDTLHYQIHHKKPFPVKGSGSLFLSLSHPHDRLRADEGLTVASVSTHVSEPDLWKGDKAEILEKVISILEMEGFLKKEDIVYMHCSDPSDWEQWTGRYSGFVGGYPQTADIKPWNMNSARLEVGLYACGDSVYPGQGIPGVVLSGMIAATKSLSDIS